MRSFRVVATIVVAAGLLPLSGGGQAIAAPGNDTYAGRTVIGALPFTVTADTSTATTDDAEAEMTAGCGLPATDAGVWWEYTAPTDGAVQIDVRGSSYLPAVLVATGGPGNWTVLNCSHQSVFLLPTVGGQTYSLLIFDGQVDGGGNGGMLQLSVVESPSQLAVDVTVDPYGIFDPHTGSATVRGTIACASASPHAFLIVDLQQVRARYTLFASDRMPLLCDQVPRPWSLEMLSPNGPFGPGEVVGTAFAVACGDFFCTDNESFEVVLRPN